MRTIASVRVDFATAAAKQVGKAFMEDVALEFGTQVAERAKQNVAPGRGPGPHPHPGPPAWQHEDTGELGDSIRSDVREITNGVECMIFTPLDRGLYLEAGWHGPSGRFYRYPWLWPAINAVQVGFRGMARTRAGVAFTGGIRGGKVATKKGANVWDTYSRGWKRRLGK